MCAQCFIWANEADDYDDDDRKGAMEVNSKWENEWKTGDGKIAGIILSIDAFCCRLSKVMSWQIMYQSLNCDSSQLNWFAHLVNVEKV